MPRRLPLTAVALVVVAESSLAAGAVSWSAGGRVVTATAAAAATAVVAAVVTSFLLRSAPPLGERVLENLAGVATALLVAASFVAGGLWLLGARKASSPAALLGAVAVGAVGLALAQRVHEKAARVVAHFLAPADHDLGDALASWSGRLSRAVPIDELLLQLAELLKPGLELSAIEVWLAADDGLQLVAALPERPARSVKLTRGNMDALSRHTVTGRGWAEVWAPDLMAGRGETLVRIAPASFTGTLCGVLVAERPCSMPPLSEQEDAILADAARRLGILLHTARLDRALQASDEALRARAAELAASRTRLASAADDARRRIERDLHDGAQQQLLALAAKVELARQVRTTDPALLATLFDELRVDAADALEALRHLAHGVYPPSLEQHGVVAAIRAAARHMGVGVEVVADGARRYPRPVETAIYFCCLEALQNVSKHAGASAVVVRLHEESNQLVVDVTDDGRGFDADGDVRGTGLVSIRDRIGAVGGNVEVRSAAGAGTRVRLVVALPVDQAPR